MIYDSFFGFKEEPFGVTPNPEFFYMSRGHEEALAHLKFCISENKGFIMLTGEIGSGKTTLMRYFIERCEKNIHTSVILNPVMEPIDLLKLISRDFGISCESTTYDCLISCLNDFLLACYTNNEKAVIFIDEAQDMSFESLEFIRLLSNLETNRTKLLQIVLIGQPELKKIISSEKLRQLDQRIAVRYHIGPLKKDEVAEYINHRLSKAGSRIVFSKNAINKIFKYSCGIPRLVNLACDRILLAAYSMGVTDLNNSVLNAAFKELGYRQSKHSFYAGIAVVFLLTVSFISIIRSDNKMIDMMLKFVLSNKKINASGKNEIKEIFYRNQDGIVTTTDLRYSKKACFINLLIYLGEKSIETDKKAEDFTKMLGYSIYAFKNDWYKLKTINMPCILRTGHDTEERWMVLLWIINNDAVVIEPDKGRVIVPVNDLKKNVAEFIILWKNKYNNPERIKLIQKKLSRIGYLKVPKKGVSKEKIIEAIKKFQKSKGFDPSGRLDDETLILLSKEDATPELYPQEIRK